MTPHVDSAPARIERVSLVTGDGRALAAAFYHPDEAPLAQVVVHGATAVPMAYYRQFAAYLAERGYRTLVYDYRGVFESAVGHPREDDASMTDWFTFDAPAAVRTLDARAPDLPLFAVGHSFGGQIAAALPGVRTPDALVTTGAQRGYWVPFPKSEWPRLVLTWYVLVPVLTGALGYLPRRAGLGADVPRGVVREWARWCRTPEYFLDDHPELAERMAAYRGRLLALSVTDDDFAPEENVRWLIEKHTGASVEHLRFAPSDIGVRRFGHFGFFRPEQRETVWPEIVGHFDETLGVGARPRALGSTVSSRDRWSALMDMDVDADLAYGRT